MRVWLQSLQKVLIRAKKIFEKIKNAEFHAEFESVKKVVKSVLKKVTSKTTVSLKKKSARMRMPLYKSTALSQAGMKGMNSNNNFIFLM